MLHVLDEPTVGQHPADVERLLPAFRELAGPVIFVEHDRSAVAGRSAIDLGPGAGSQGGRVVFSGTPQQLWEADTASRALLQPAQRPVLPRVRPAPEQFLVVKGARLRNLDDI